MKRTRIEILGNIVLTIGLVAAVGLACLYLTNDETAQSGIVTYSSRRVVAPSRTAGSSDHSWVVPHIAQSDFRAQPVRRAPQTAASAASTTSSRSIVGTGLRSGASVGGGTVSGATATTHRSTVVSGGTAAHVSSSVVVGSGSSQPARSVAQVSEPFADDNLERPNARPRPKVDGDTGKDEQFPETPLPIGGALVPLLLCASAYFVHLKRKKGYRL